MRAERRRPGGRRQEAVRWGVRLLMLGFVAAALVPAWPHPRAGAYVLSASPLVALSSTLATRSLALTAGSGLVVTLVVLWRRRWFCRWLCPVGVCTEAAGRLGQRFGRQRPRLPAAGRWIALVTLGGALWAYPLLLWLDPLALFAGLFTIPAGGAPWPAWIAMAGFPLLVAASCLWPGSWCLRLCPLGGLQDLLALATRRWRAAPGAGVGAEPTPPLNVGRRAAVGMLLGLAWAAAVRRVRGAESRVLRPPGSAAEADFTGLCLRCGNCIGACPAGVLGPDLGGQGVASWFTPVMEFRADYCREDCVRCTETCPSGAIRRLATEDKRHAPIGLACVDYDVCLLSEDRECAACRNHCPFDAVGTLFSEETYTLKVLVDPDRCPGCGACQVACPTTPKAIFVIARDFRVVESARDANNESCCT